MKRWLADLATALFPWRRRVPFVCDFSARRGVDLHDYKREAGGDGSPDHFREYSCWQCGKAFTI